MLLGAFLIDCHSSYGFLSCDTDHASKFEGTVLSQWTNLHRSLGTAIRPAKIGLKILIIVPT